jgi:hypothetical protein
MTKYISSPILLLILLCCNVAYAVTLENYFKNVYETNKTQLKTELLPILKAKLTEYKISDNDKIYELLFLHFLFTTTDAVDGLKGGILGIPYFWHWVQPNPRHEIMYEPEQCLLKNVRPPDGYKKYKSYADIDRTPCIYLMNLIESKPIFSHKSCGPFYTFGWCSEREMAFNTILKILGYTSKIKQEDIHVWTEVCLTINAEVYIIVIDNTFNGFTIKKTDRTLKSWVNDIGNGTQVRWYNQTFSSTSEVTKVRNLEISEPAINRMNTEIKKWIEE